MTYTASRLNVKASEAEQKIFEEKTKFDHYEKNYLKKQDAMLLKIEDFSELFKTSLTYLSDIKQSINKCATSEQLRNYSNDLKRFFEEKTKTDD